ncbi:hypothetical protein BH10PSE13_BH10PSE13_04990 [soil metagenome]
MPCYSQRANEFDLLDVTRSDSDMASQTAKLANNVPFT